MGGAAYLAKRVKVLRSEEKNPALLLAAGDMIQGNLWSNINRGQAVIELMNLMKFDAMVVGNHEFDFGRRVLQERIAQAEFPVLGANVKGVPGLKPYIIRQINGVRLGILGLTLEKTPEATHPHNVMGLTFMSPVAAYRKYEKELKKQADIIIILSHIGFAEDRLLAETVFGIDVIIGGHSHTKVLQPALAGRTVVLQAWEHGKALGVLDLTIDQGKIVAYEGRLEEIRPEAAHMDESVAAMVNCYAADIDHAMKVTIGQACRDLDGEYVRFRETNLGNLVTDAMREASGADVALMNGGGIRKSLKKGDVSLSDIHSMLPFDNYMIVITLRGQDLVKILEHGLARAEAGKGAFLQVSGIKVSYDVQAPAGRRIKAVDVAGRILDEKKEYTIAVNDFMAAGGDGYMLLKSVTGGIKADKGRMVRDLVAEYIRARGEICPQREGRIIPIEFSGNNRGFRQ